MTLVAWNIRTPLDTHQGTERLQRQTAVIAHELRRYNIDIAALSQTRIFGEDPLTKGEGYTFFCMGLPEGKHRLIRVGFAVRKRQLDSVPEAPQGINE